MRLWHQVSHTKCDILHTSADEWGVPRIPAVTETTIVTMYKAIRKSLFAVLLLGVVGLFSSCVSPTEVVYLQDVQGNSSETLKQNYQTIIQKDDQLYISVSSKQPELVTPFMQTEMGRMSSANTTNTKAPIGYLVNDDGNIVLPIIGKVKAAGKSCTQLADDIAAALRAGEYISDASVNVQITNFKFTVLGEVSGNGIKTIQGQRVTILEAVSMAGDLTIDGNRDITLIREKDGKREVVKLDLRDKDIINSPYYYLQQNDVIYVTPSERKINTRSEEMQVLGFAMSGLGLVTAIIAICAM